MPSPNSSPAVICTKLKRLHAWESFNENRLSKKVRFVEKWFFYSEYNDLRIHKIFAISVLRSRSAFYAMNEPCISFVPQGTFTNDNIFSAFVLQFCYFALTGARAFCLRLIRLCTTQFNELWVKKLFAKRYLIFSRFFTFNFFF